MAQVAAYLDVFLKGQSSSFVSSGLEVYQAVDSDQIAGDGVLIEVNGEDYGWFYDSSTDTVFLETTDGFAESLTRKGDYWQWIVGGNDLGSPATAPGATVTKTARIVVERLTSGAGSAVTRMVSKPFTLTIKRAMAFTPQSISGLIAWYDSYDLTEAVAATVASWADKTLYDRDLAEATNKPTRRNTGAGRPYLEFDGTNDLLASTLADAGLACTALVVFKIGAYDATTRGIIQVGGTNGGRLAFNSTNLKGLSGSDAADGTLPSLNTWCVAVITKTASGAITVQKGTGSPVSQASTNAVTVGTIGLGDTAADSVADVDIAEVMVWDNVLSAANINRAVRAMQFKWEATG